MGAMKNELFGDTVYSYSRADALSDGVLVDLNKYISVKESPFKFPMACTDTVYNIIERAVENKEYSNDYEGVVWDIMFMAIHGKVQTINESTILFEVLITGTDQPDDLYTFKCQCHAGDNLEPVLTIMLPTED